MTTRLSPISRRVAPALALSAALLAGCTVQKQSTPALSGPSTVAMSLSVSATPDVLPRDGSSAATITLTTRDVSGNPVQQRILLSTTAGTLSSADVTTNSSGAATVRLTAPSVNSSATSAVVTAQPVDSTNIATPTSLSRTVTVAFTGPNVPVPSFTFSPSSPGQYDSVTFDASATTLNGIACGSSCTYVFDFGDNNNATGQLVSHRFQSQGTFAVTLTVTGPGGASATTTKNVSVGSPKSITASITVSPTDPKVGETVYFDGTGSSTPDGTSITNWSWDLGNGTTATGSKVSTSYSTTNSFTVRLTVTDALGRTATTTTTVTTK